MKTSPNGIKFIAEHEGEVLKVYADPVGLPTLGVGHLLTESEKKQMPLGTKITKEQSREYLAKDLARFERAINSNVKVPLNQNQFDALASFSFNIGESAFKRSTTFRTLNAKDYEGAADAMLAWNKARNRQGKMVELPGLTRRRKEERTLFLKPVSAAAPQETANNPSSGTPSTGESSNNPPPIEKTVTQEKGNTTVELTTKNEQDVSQNANVQAPTPYNGIGFWATIKRDLGAAFGGNLTMQGFSEYATKASGWPDWVVALIGKLALVVVGFTVAYFLFRIVHFIWDGWKKNQKTKIEAEAATSTVRKDITWV